MNVLGSHLAFWAWFRNGARKIGQLLLILNPIPNCKLPLQTFLVSLGTLILSLLDLMLLNERPLLGH